jgi:hypothetical protein
VPTFADRGCHMVSVTDPYGRILRFLDWNLYFFFQLKIRNMNWLINKKSQLSLENKITISYKAIIKPAWTYGIELWGCSKPSNTKILEAFQSKTLRKLANAPWYISNVILHNDLSIPYVTEVTRTYAKNHKNWTAQNSNQLIKRPVQSTENRKKTQQKVARGSH